MVANASQCLFWPGLVASIRLTRAQCCECNQIATFQPSETLCAPSTIDFPFQHTVTDFFEFAGNKYIVYADRFTGWVEVKLLPKMDATSICNHLRHWFCTFGDPQELSSDGGPPFDSEEYHHLLRTWGVTMCLTYCNSPVLGRSLSFVE